MPRQPRKASATGIHHIVLRGVNRQRIFEEAEDYAYFLECVQDTCANNAMTLLAYCCMSNHVHLLIEEANKSCSWSIRQLAGRYAIWFNRKYKRVGHLFQNRFHSEPVENDAYLHTVTMYIHRNPVEAGLSSTPAEYQWSSRYSLDHPPGLINHERLEELLSISSLLDAEKRQGMFDPMYVPMLKHKQSWADEEAWDLLSKICGATTASDFQKLLRDEQQRAVRTVSPHLSIRQISRLTGISRDLISRWRS
ncbi:MAG: transposase [Propionibacteriaceae bacterium]|jgi:REP element-mobilizing transposase RayT|nr:transposase [Propionibacteriaceae bacterium]